METFDKHLKEELKNKKFKKLFDEERKLIELSLLIHKLREKEGLTQKEVAKKAHITQQQLSKIENGENCNLLTLLKVCNSLKINLNFETKKDKTREQILLKNNKTCSC
jgi:transcriptional regulator with XRE-family HTH domain